MLVVAAAICVLLIGLGVAVLMASRRGRVARARILQLAREIDAVASGIEADFAGQPANDALKQLAAHAKRIAQPARTALGSRRVPVVLPSYRLYAEERQLHHGHGEIVHLRSQADACLRAVGQGRPQRKEKLRKIA